MSNIVNDPEQNPDGLGLPSREPIIEEPDAIAGAEEVDTSDDPTKSRAESISNTPNPSPPSTPKLLDSSTSKELETQTSKPKETTQLEESEDDNGPASDGKKELELSESAHNNDAPADDGDTQDALTAKGNEELAPSQPTDDSLREDKLTPPKPAQTTSTALDFGNRKREIKNNKMTSKRFFVDSADAEPPVHDQSLLEVPVPTHRPFEHPELMRMPLYFLDVNDFRTYPTLILTTFSFPPNSSALPPPPPHAFPDVWKSFNMPYTATPPAHNTRSTFMPLTHTLKAPPAEVLGGQLPLSARYVGAEDPDPFQLNPLLSAIPIPPPPPLARRIPFEEEIASSSVPVPPPPTGTVPLPAAPAQSGQALRSGPDTGVKGLTQTDLERNLSIRQSKPRGARKRRKSVTVYNSDCYLYKLPQLLASMPHLRNLSITQARNNNTGFAAYFDVVDVSQGMQVPSQANRKAVHAENKQFAFNNLQPRTNMCVTTRYLLVSDITPRLINNIGSTFWMNPEFFELHLNRSGYSLATVKEPPPERSWNTWGARKPFTSVRWWRPVLRRSIFVMNAADREKILWQDITKDTAFKQGRVKSESWHLNTNIFRKEIALVSTPDPETGPGAPAYPAAWEERITIHYSKTPTGPGMFVILLDPVPNIERREEVRGTKNDPVDMRTTSDLFYWPHKRVLPDVRATLEDMFNGTQWTTDRIKGLEPALQGTSGSTFDELARWLKGDHLEDSGFSLVLEIIRIITQDTAQLIERVYVLLNEIEDHAMMEHLLQQRLAYWRRLTINLQRELESVSGSLLQFAEFIQDIHHDAEVQHAVDTTQAKIAAVLKHIETKQGSLRADLALLENKRGISQAESVGRLTELGFIFIPISCVASMFSMQVTVLQNAVPVQFFVLASFIVVFAAYIVRLSVRSSLVVSYKRWLLTDIQTFGALNEGTPVSTRLYLQYLADRSWKMVQNKTIPQIFVLAAFISPIALVWTKPGLDVNYKVMMLVLGIVCIIPTSLMLVTPHWRAWLTPYARKMRRDHISRSGPTRIRFRPNRAIRRFLSNDENSEHDSDSIRITKRRLGLPLYSIKDRFLGAFSAIPGVGRLFGKRNSSSSTSSSTSYGSGSSGSITERTGSSAAGSPGSSLRRIQRETRRRSVIDEEHEGPVMSGGASPAQVTELKRSEVITVRDEKEAEGRQEIGKKVEDPEKSEDEERKETFGWRSKFRFPRRGRKSASLERQTRSKSPRRRKSDEEGEDPVP